MTDVFLSYSREDQPTARRFAAALELEGFSVWWDDALNPGETFDQVTEQALRESAAVIVLWTPRSVSSRWVRSEATQADRLGKLVPVTMEACERPILFELSHTADLTGWDGDSQDVRWRGFVERLRRQVQRAATGAAPAASPAPNATVATNKAGPKARAGHLWPWAIAAITALVIAGALAYFKFPSARTTTDASIAVLPFRDMSPDKDQEYLADGIAEEILNTLASIRGLKVSARTSSFAFKGKDTDLREVGRALGVRNILEGSVRKDGDQLRITAQLIDAHTDAHLWSRTYDRPLQDVFDIQEDIAREAASALQVSLGVGIGQRPGMTRNAEAYDTYLAAIKAFNSFQPAEFRRGMALAEESVRLDPSFALGWLAVVFGYHNTQAMGGGAITDLEGRTATALLQVQKLAPDLPQLHVRLGDSSIQQGRWQKAIGHFNDARAAYEKLGINPDATTGSGFTSVLVQVGKSREAIPILERARAIDPLNPAISLYLINANASVGHYEAAMAEADRIESAGERWNVVRGAAFGTALGSGDRTQIAYRLKSQIEIQSDPAARAFNERILALLNSPAEARGFLLAQRSTLPPAGLAATAPMDAFFGDPDAALQKMSSAAGQGSTIAVATLMWLPVFAPMRELPGFKTLVRDMGLVDYWREAGWPEDFCKPTTGDDFECR